MSEWRLNRRNLLRNLIGLSALRSSLAWAQSHSSGQPLSGNPSESPRTYGLLSKSGSIASQGDGQVIENLDIEVRDGDAVTILHDRVVLRNCRIRHAGGNGVFAGGCSGLRLENLEIEHIGAPTKGVGPDENRNNINLYDCPKAIIHRVRAAKGASNIYVQESPEAHLSFLELYDARGPMPRGQNVQFNQSHRSLLEDFSAENGPTSWTEDNVSVFHSNGCIVRRGLVFYNNSPTGDGVMVEGSFDCLIEDIDAVQQGNGAFAAVTQEDMGSGGCRFRRCRTRDSYNAPRDGRAAPTSNGLSIYTLISAGAQKHVIEDCAYFNLANPRNLIWRHDAVERDWSFVMRNFTPRGPIRLQFPWDLS